MEREVCEFENDRKRTDRELALVKQGSDRAGGQVLLCS